MSRPLSFSSGLLGLFLLVWINIPRNVSDGIRSSAVETVFPAWRCAEEIRDYLLDRPSASGSKKTDLDHAERLKLENQILLSQVEWMKEWMIYRKGLSEPQQKYVEELLQRQVRALPAQVIYRDPSSWSSSLWINVGEEDNRMIGTSVIAKNSPVVEGDSLIGVIDYVGNRQSRVRLITDSGLTPAVRTVRQGGQNRDIVYLIDALSTRLTGRSECQELLQMLKGKLTSSEEGDIYLAKGELRGCGHPFWHARRPILKGFGFNYDYPDALGTARELRTGRPLNGSDKPLPLIQEGDLLVTSGLDGVFPAGLSVAVATTVFPLKEGGFAYEIEARPTASSLNDLRVVFVLPSLSGE